MLSFQLRVKLIIKYFFGNFAFFWDGVRVGVKAISSIAYSKQQA
jgi:hypothetical protein